MFERILVPLDGSPVAERAIPAAARIARAFGGSVIVLSVVTPPVTPGKFSVPEEYPKADTEEELAEATAYLRAIAQSDKLVGITTEVQTLVGATAPTILSATQSLHADLIVLCTHGYTGFKRWRLGSVSEKVIRHAPVPVFVLREGELEPAARLSAGLAQATSQRGILQLMRVVDIPSGYGKFRSRVDSFYDAQMRAEAKRAYEQYLETVAKRFSEGELAKYNLAVTTVVTTDPDVAEAIVQTAEQGKDDFIAMATHGRGGVQRWALGSITERVLHATKVPLFIIRPEEV